LWWKKKDNQTRDPIAQFRSDFYIRHNCRRQEHLASLGLDLANRSVLEVGAGIGDHTSFFLDRDCTVTVTEVREENLQVIKKRFADVEVLRLDLDAPEASFNRQFELVYCYGTLYHLRHPGQALEFLASRCTDTFLLETCVSYTDNEQINALPEVIEDPSQASSGIGCRPARSWVFNKLKALFPFAYIPITQPWHEEFPLDWTDTRLAADPKRLWRSVFIASRRKIANDRLVDSIPMKQVRH
jgi:hypothetical protein